MLRLSAEYAATGRSKCSGCNRFIEARVIRVGFDGARYHLACLPHPPLPETPFTMADVKGKISKAHRERMAECLATRGASEDDVRPTRLEPDPGEVGGGKGKRKAKSSSKKGRKKAKGAGLESPLEEHLAEVKAAPSGGLTALLATPPDELRAMTKRNLEVTIADCTQRELQLLLRCASYGQLSKTKEILIGKLYSAIKDGLPPMCPVCSATRICRSPDGDYWREWSKRGSGGGHIRASSRSPYAVTDARGVVWCRYVGKVPQWICTGGKRGVDPDIVGHNEEHDTDYSPFRWIPCVGHMKIDKALTTPWFPPPELLAP
eukprot:m.79991 g.79991  ORF g.79991 m.79991 type:complete len:319 (+) comp10860_c0_seq2:57-1013(+)